MIALVVRFLATAAGIALLASPAAAVGRLGHDAPSHLRASLSGDVTSFVRGLEFKQVLRICNAYGYKVGLDIFLNSAPLSQTPLTYKACQEFQPPLKAGDKVDFTVEGSSVGTFTVSDLPASDAILMMVIFRHDTLSTAVAFESHVFANLPGTQVAVIDAYRGKATSEVRIRDAEPLKQGVAPRSELLRYDNVVAINSGVYGVELQAPQNKTVQAKGELVAVPRESYVVLRCGVDAEEGDAYPEELVIFPHSDKALLGAATPTSRCAVVLSMAMALLGAFRPILV